MHDGMETLSPDHYITFTLCSHINVTVFIDAGPDSNFACFGITGITKNHYENIIVLNILEVAICLGAVLHRRYQTRMAFLKLESKATKDAYGFFSPLLGTKDFAKFFFACWILYCLWILIRSVSASFSKILLKRESK